MIQELTVGIDGSPASFEAFDQATMLCLRVDAALKCVFVVDSRRTQVPLVYAGGTFDVSAERIYLPLDPNLRDHFARVAKDLAEFGKNCLALCERRAQERGLHVSTVLREGYPTAELCEESKSSDILIVGQRGENAHYKRVIVGSTTEDLVRTSPRPVQVVPKARESMGHVLFIYDGSRTAENALRYYVNALAGFAEQFTMAFVGENGEIGDPETELRYLSHHGIRFHTLGPEGATIESIMKEIESQDVDLLLVGSSGKRKMREFFLGSTAAQFVRRSWVPVLVVS